MKTFGELTEITQVPAGGIFAVNNAEDTVSNKITIENLTSQIVSAVNHDVNIAIGDSTDSITDSTATNSNVHINLIENGTVDSSHSIIGTGSTSVTSDSSGNITINSTDTIFDPTTLGLGTAASKDVAVSGNASNNQVVLGNDSRLSDARPASDVSSWAKASTKPSYTASEVGAYSTSEVDNLLSSIETNIDWKESVDTFADIAITYPSPVDGWTVNVKDTDYTYRYNGSNWVVISANAIPEATDSVNGLMTTTQVTKLAGISSGAEVNQNAFSNIKVGSTTVAADSKTDTIELIAGSNITLTPDATNDTVTIAATDTTYSSKTAASGGTDVSLVTTGEKYTWNNKSTLALGETSSTAYRGDRGKTAYDHSQATHARTDATKTEASSTNGNIKINGSETTVYTHPSGTNPHGTTKSDVGLGNVGNFKAVSTVASQGLTDTEKSNARDNIGAGTSNLELGTTATTAAAGNHKHNTTIANYSSNSPIPTTLSPGGRYIVKVGDGSGAVINIPDKLSNKALIALTGSGTAGSDKGSGVSPRYIPSLWTFDSGITVANGEVYLIKIPVAGGTYGVWLSLNNGTTYYPVAISSAKGRFTTHYAANTVIAVTYESAGVCTCFAKAGADSTADVTGIFRVLNDYDSGNTNTYVTQTATTTNADYEVLFSATADNTTRTEGARKNTNLKFNPSTGNLQATQLNGVDIGSSPKFTDTTYSSKTAASGGTDVSLVTTGEKYTWNNKSTLAIGTTATTAAAGNHTHTVSIAADSGTNALTLAASTKYKLTAGGSTFIFTTPPNTTYTAATAAPGNIASSGAQGSSTNYARQDHTHGIALATGDSNGQVKIAGTNVSVKGLGSNAYTSTEYLPIAGGTLTGRLTTTKPIKPIISGSGTAAEDKGSGVSPRYFPAKWTFDTGVTAANGDIINIKIPVAGSGYGVYVSINNGTTYYPVALNGTAALTTHFAKNTYITLQLDTGGSVASIYPLAGGDSKGTVTGGVWRVMNFYDTNTDVRPSAYCDTAAETAAKVASCSGYSLLSKSYIHIIMVNSNTAASALTLNINGKGAKAIYINGSASSDTNYTLPAGSYIVYYNNSKYYFRTDGTIAGDISGDSENVRGTVAIANGGTGATSRLNAVKALTNENVGTSATYFLTITDSWGKAGYTSVANAKTVLGLGAAAYMGTGTSSTTVALGNHTHGLSLATDSGTSSITLAASTKYKLTAGGSTYIFTTPPNTTYSSKAAASGGTDVSLCTTGEKYTWNNKSTVPTNHKSAATTYGVGGNGYFGHVDLTDTYTSNVGSAANGVGASQTALYNVYSNYLVPYSLGSKASKLINCSQGDVWGFHMGNLVVIRGWVVINTTLSANSELRITESNTFPRNLEDWWIGFAMESSPTCGRCIGIKVDKSNKALYLMSKSVSYSSGASFVFTGYYETDQY